MTRRDQAQRHMYVLLETRAMCITRPDWPANGLFFAFSRPLAEARTDGPAALWPIDGRRSSTLHCSHFTLALPLEPRYAKSREQERGGRTPRQQTRHSFIYSAYFPFRFSSHVAAFTPYYVKAVSLSALFSCVHAMYFRNVEAHLTT